MVQGMSRDAWEEFSKTILVRSLWNPLLGPFCVIEKGYLHSLWGVFLAFQPMP